MSFLTKYALIFLQPLGFVWLLLTLWLMSLGLRRRWRTAAMPAIIWALLTLITCTPFSSRLLAGLEDQYPRVTIADLQPADAIICLGGGAEPSLTEPTGMHLKVAADRLATALTLAAERKAPVLVIGGGGYPFRGETLSEAEATTAHLRRHVALPAEVVSLGLCSDTFDEAKKIAALAAARGWKRLLLVTSANHMPRAAAVFGKIGGPEVVPVPCNYQSSFNRPVDIRWLHPPFASGFEIFGAWFHETIGSWIYRRRGWI